MFFISQARINLCGEVNRATLVDNMTRHGAAIMGFRMFCLEAGSSFVVTLRNCRLSESFERLGTIATPTLLWWIANRLGKHVIYFDLGFEAVV